MEIKLKPTDDNRQKLLIKFHYISIAVSVVLGMSLNLFGASGLVKDIGIAMIFLLLTLSFLSIVLSALLSGVFYTYGLKTAKTEKPVYFYFIILTYILALLCCFVGFVIATLEIINKLP